MSQIKLMHSGGNGVSIVAPDNNPASDRTLKLPSDGDGTILTTTSTLGKVLQVIPVEKVDTWSSVADFVFEDVPGLAATITMSAATNKVWVVVDVMASSNYWVSYLKLFRGTTEIGVGATGMQSNQGNHFSSMGTDATNSNSNGFVHHHTRQILDVPGAGTHTYKIQSTARNGAYLAYINRTVPDRNANEEYDNRYTSRLTLWEVAP